MAWRRPRKASREQEDLNLWDLQVALRPMDSAAGIS